MLGKIYPYYYTFYPSEEVIKKLLIRMSQIKDTAAISKNLWRGFEESELENGWENPHQVNHMCSKFSHVKHVKWYNLTDI